VSPFESDYKLMEDACYIALMNDQIVWVSIEEVKLSIHMFQRTQATML